MQNRVRVGIWLNKARNSLPVNVHQHGQRCLRNPGLKQQHSDHANHSQSQKPLLYNPEELPCEQAHDLVEVVAAPQNPLIHTNDDIGIRFIAGCRPLFNSVKGLLGGMTKH